MATLTVGDLIEALEQYPEDMVVRLAFQPSRPLEYNLDRYDPVFERNEILYLLEGDQIGYAPFAANRDGFGGWNLEESGDEDELDEDDDE